MPVIGGMASSGHGAAFLSDVCDFGPAQAAGYFHGLR